LEVQVWTPLLSVVQVVFDDGGVLLETSIHPQQANAATNASARNRFFRLVGIALILTTKSPTRESAAHGAGGG
jgi:hypothetical protein